MAESKPLQGLRNAVPYIKPARDSHPKPSKPNPHGQEDALREAELAIELGTSIDALTSSNPYKNNGYSPEMTKQIIRMRRERNAPLSLKVVDR